MYILKTDEEYTCNYGYTNNKKQALKNMIYFYNTERFHIYMF